MSQQELVKQVVAALEELGIDYMMTGSFVSSYQGEPRSTHDADFVVAVSRESARRLADAFSSHNYYLDEAAILDAVSRGQMFNLLDATSGDKVDFWVLKDTPFDRSRFARKIKDEMMGVQVYVSAPEDTILAKLRWAKESGGSEKQFTDALRVYEVQFGRLDVDYLTRWARELDVESLWARLVDEARPAERQD